MVLRPRTRPALPSWKRPRCSLLCAVKGGPWPRQRPAMECASERVPLAGSGARLSACVFPPFSDAVAAPAVQEPSGISIAAPALQATLGALGARTSCLLCSSLTPEAGAARAARVTCSPVSPLFPLRVPTPFPVLLLILHSNLLVFGRFGVGVVVMGTEK